jgi:hypothetical protein
VVVAYTQIFWHPPAGIERNNKNPVSTAWPQDTAWARDLLSKQRQCQTLNTDHLIFPVPQQLHTIKW